jgi:hypothetical protein
MPRQAAVRTFYGFDEPDFATPRDHDYDADYRALDLRPGASLREIVDRALLLHTTFDVDALPPALRVLAGERSQTIDRAAAELSRYWKTHGAAPPTRRGDDRHGLGSAEGLVVALAEALAAGNDAATNAGAAASVTVLHPHLARQPVPHRMQLPPTERSASPVLAAAPREPPNPAKGQRGEPQTRRGWSTAGAVLFKVAMVALVIAAVLRVVQYRADHPYLSAFAAPNPAVTTAMPGERPAQWAGPVSRQMAGAAAPAIAGHQRQN